MFDPILLFSVDYATYLLLGPRLEAFPGGRQHGPETPRKPYFFGSLALALARMNIAVIMSRIAAELALFAGAGFLLFAVNDVLVDLIYFTRRLWRGLTVYTRYPRVFASYFVFKKDPGFIAILVPAWDESTVIAAMLKALLDRLDYDDFRVFVGQYRNDPATIAAIASVADPRVEPVPVDADGPTTKADCLNHLYGIM